MLLDVNGLSAAYGKGDVVHNVTFSVAAGKIVALIGPNGAGKSTVLKAVSGTLSADCGTQTGGTIHLDGKMIGRLRPDQLVEKGMALAPDGRRIFKSMTVKENLEMGAFLVRGKGRIAHNLSDVLALFPDLSSRLAQNAASLSGGEQQMLALGRALMSNPRLLLVDEPSLGLAPRLLDDAFGRLIQIRDEQLIGVLIVEQNVNEVLKIADSVVALKLGSVEYSGNAKKLRESESLLKRIFL